ncbi:MAG: CRISPR-associated protein Cas7 [Runella zeae]
MKPYLYLRGLKVAEHTVFAVQDGQKTYYDPIHNRSVAYSSGQQVKRSVLDSLAEYTGEMRAPITFNYEINSKDAIENKEPWSPCDPSYADQLIGGWMRARPGVVTLKRRSPLSISAMRPLHPLLVSMNTENLTFDRSDKPEQHPVRVLNATGQELTSEQIEDFLQSKQRTLPRRNWIPGNTRTTGLFVYDIAIDRSRLFSVAVNQHEPELTKDSLEKLKEQGWILSKNGERLICPAERREKLIKALAKALVEWHITSNQARTYSPQTTLALAVSKNASLIASAIRADLNEEDIRKADPIVESFEGVETFISLSCKGHVRGVVGAADAMVQAEKRIVELLSEYDYEA